MNNRALTLSILMAVIAVFLVEGYVASIEEAARKKLGVTRIVFKAKRNIKEMETVTEDLIETREVPKEFIEPSAIAFDTGKENEEEVSKSLRGLAGAIAIVPIKKGEQITRNKITDPGMRTGLSHQVTPGKRGITIPVSDISGVSKLVKPGDRVDIIAVIDMGTGKENKITKTVLQDIVVLATGRNVNNNVARTVDIDPISGKEKVKNLAEDANFVTTTLEVEPGQAQALMLLMNNGDNALYMSLRNNDDNERNNMGITTLYDVLGQDIGRVPMPRGLAGQRR